MAENAHEVAQLQEKIKELENKNTQLQAQLSLKQTKDEVVTKINRDVDSQSVESDEKQGSSTSNSSGDGNVSENEKIKYLETQLNNYKRANKELAMKAVHYNAMNTIQRNVPTIWHQPHININHISTFISKIPLAHKEKLWERHCDSEDNKRMVLSNLDSLMFSIVALCIKIHDRSIKTPSQDKLMPRLKIYCKNIKWNIKQKHKKEQREKEEIEKKKQVELEKEKEKEKNDEETADDTAVTTGGSKKDNDKKTKKKKKKKSKNKNDTENENENEDSNVSENKEDTKDNKDDGNENGNDGEKKKIKYLLYDDFVNNFHSWMIQGPPLPTPEQQHKMLYYQRYENEDDDLYMSDDDDNDEESGFLQIIDKVEECLKLIDKARY